MYNVKIHVNYYIFLIVGSNDPDRPSTRPGPSHPPGGLDPWGHPTYPGMSNKTKKLNKIKITNSSE